MNVAKGSYIRMGTRNKGKKNNNKKESWEMKHGRKEKAICLILASTEKVFMDSVEVTELAEILPVFVLIFTVSYWYLLLCYSSCLFFRHIQAQQYSHNGK